MYARMDEVSFHFNATMERVQELLDEGYTLEDDDENELADPIAYAEKDIASRTHTGTIFDFYKFCEENGIEIVKKD